MKLQPFLLAVSLLHLASATPWPQEPAPYDLYDCDPAVEYHCPPPPPPPPPPPSAVTPPCNATTIAPPPPPPSPPCPPGTIGKPAYPTNGTVPKPPSGMATPPVDQYTGAAAVVSAAGSTALLAAILGALALLL